MNKKLTYKELKEKVSEMENKLSLKDEEVNRLRSSFLSNISHEIRTPMNVIVGFSYLLNDPNYNQNQKEFFIEEINKNSKELLRLIDNIILTAKIETDDIKLDMDVCDIQLLMEELYTQIQKFFKANSIHGIELRLVQNSGKSNYRIFTDKEKIKRAMFNMIENAIKFTKNNSVEFGFKIIENKFADFFIKENGLRTKSSTKEIQNEKASFSIEDTVDIYETRIGLTISDKLIRLLGGKLKIKSSKEKGSSFNFTLPLLVDKPV
ncbi:MAG: HAMP domain-containing histidine kinase [Bacteroidetes bacterium]|nr:HAMP domain-containing histidine kinase [Bacteroidota bacterium]